MFIDEPEGNGFSELNQYLGAASALGTAIDIKTIDNKSISGYLNHSQESLPNFIEIFVLKEDRVGKKIIKIPVNNIGWFKLKANGITESYIDENGIPMAKLPILSIATKKFAGNGKIINPGVTSIYGEETNFSGKITTKEKINTMNKIKSGGQGVSGKNVKVAKMLSDHGSQTVTALNEAEVGCMDNRGSKSSLISIRIGEITLFKIDTSLISSFFDNIFAIFKK